MSIDIPEDKSGLSESGVLAGTLYLVATPIGNLADITQRAISVLGQVDFVAAEDTRHSQRLLSHLGIKSKLLAYHEHNEDRVTPRLLHDLESGKSIALISDAGTPLISDPGYRLIKLAQENDIPTTVIPGACALIAGLCASGLPTDSFIFEGFLPPKTATRRKKLENFREEKRTIVFYESPHRLIKTLNDMQEVLEDPFVVCAREITKKFEEVKKGRASELIEYFSKKKVKGEFVLMLQLTY